MSRSVLWDSVSGNCDWVGVSTSVRVGSRCVVQTAKLCFSMFKSIQHFQKYLANQPAHP